MNTLSVTPAAIRLATPQSMVLSGHWTARGLAAIEKQLDALVMAAAPGVAINAAGIDALDTAGAWVLQKLIHQTAGDHNDATAQALQPQFVPLLEMVKKQAAEQAAMQAPVVGAAPSAVEGLGRGTAALWEQSVALVGFVGESALALGRCLVHPPRLRWRPVLFNIRSAGVDALGIVGLLSLLLGVVVAYQGADQLRRYGANIFVADLVGLSMLREFAPLITAIILAGRSGSAYAAQIGTMVVTEEIDAMRTIGIDPLELLVVPKLIALVIAVPLLTVFADGLGVLGGMLMARAQLGVGFGEFLERFVKAVSPTAYLIGIGKAPVFAVVIAVVGCFQGFRTHGGADSVGRQTTRSVVQSIFLVIVVDALFSVAFSALDL